MRLRSRYGGSGVRGAAQVQEKKFRDNYRECDFCRGSKKNSPRTTKTKTRRKLWGSKNCLQRSEGHEEKPTTTINPNFRGLTGTHLQRRRKGKEKSPKRR